MKDMPKKSIRNPGLLNYGLGPDFISYNPLNLLTSPRQAKPALPGLETDPQLIFRSVVPEPTDYLARRSAARYTRDPRTDYTIVTNPGQPTKYFGPDHRQRAFEDYRKAVRAAHLDDLRRDQANDPKSSWWLGPLTGDASDVIDGHVASTR